MEIVSDDFHRTCDVILDPYRAMASLECSEVIDLRSYRT